MNEEPVESDPKCDPAGDVSPSGDSPAEPTRVELLIEELKQRTRELEEANRELRRVSHYRSLFLSRMSHELRTPLTSILGFSEILLEQEELSPAQRRFCEKIRDSGMQLHDSLNQLVDLSRIEAGQMELFVQEFSLRETLRESCVAVARLAQKREVRVDYELDPGLTTVVSDQGKLRQVLYNFLVWAVGRSEPGEQVSMRAMPGDAGGLRIAIEDRGPTSAQVSEMLEPSGTGSEASASELGIVISRRLLQVMEGKTTLGTRQPTGLSVFIDLPAKPSRVLG